jgi:hypothetical protein
MRDTIDMAREAGIIDFRDAFSEEHVQAVLQDLKAFEALVRADERNRTWTQEHWTEYERSIAAQEREACAKVCEDEICSCCWDDEAKAAAEHLAEAIRARGENT